MISEINSQILKKYSANVLPPNGAELQPHFHLNTLLYRILTNLEQNASKTKEGWTSLIDWTEKTKEFICHLPKNIKVKDATTGRLVNPFEPCFQAFTPSELTKKDSHDSFNPNLYTSVCQMHYACLGKNPTDHLNILEVLENCRLVKKEDVKKFCNEVLGMKETPEESIQEFINEMEGSCMLNLTNKVNLCGDSDQAKLFTNKSNTENAQIDKNKIYSTGYHGELSEFEIFKSQEHVVIIQRRHMQGTSVTNLAETLRDKLKETYGANTRIYEAYEEDCVNGRFTKADEIIGDPGTTAGWIPTPAENIPGFTEHTLTTLD